MTDFDWFAPAPLPPRPSLLARIKARLRRAPRPAPPADPASWWIA